MTTTPPRLYSMREAAHLLNLSYRTLWRIVRRGEIEHVRMGEGPSAPIKIAEPVLQEFINRHTVPEVTRDRDN